jgi:hypothetical protein
MYKRSILFFTENAWAFGQIHNALVKRLWERGIYAHVLDWRISYSPTEVEYLKRKFDLFYTNPPQVPHLMNVFGVPKERIVTVAHAEVDIHKAVQAAGSEMFDGLKAFAGINESMIFASAAFGVKRVPDVVLNGIDFDHFYSPVSNSLQTVGYAGALSHHMSSGVDCKRKHLVPATMEGLPFAFKDHTFMNHLCMAGFYETIDALLLPSSYEACGLPIMEAAAAGRLVLCSAGVGYFDGNFGVNCRVLEGGWVQDAKAALSAHRDPVLYKAACESAQQYARENFDWSNRMDAWVKLIE